MHQQPLLIHHLQPVHSHVARPAHRIPRDNLGKCDEAASIARPAGEDGQTRQRGVFPFDHLANRSTADHRWPKADGTQSPEEILATGDQAAQPVRKSEIEERAQALRELAQILHAQSPRHALGTAQEIDRHGNVEALNALEQEGAIPLGGAFATRSATSVISRSRETSVVIRASCPLLSRRSRNSRRSLNMCATYEAGCRGPAASPCLPPRERYSRFLAGVALRDVPGRGTCRRGSRHTAACRRDSRDRG